MTVKLTAAAKARNIDAMLRDKYNDTGWAYLTEVRDAISLGRSHSRADALAFSLWEGRGLELHGHEIKSDRVDLLRELRRPDKAEAVQKFCDRWWLVLSDKALIKDGELPPTWGLMAPAKGVLRVLVKAPKLTPVPWTKQFVCGVIRQVATKYMSRSEHQTILERVRKEDRSTIAALDNRMSENDLNTIASLEARLKQSQREADSLRSAIANYEQVSGLTISTFAGWGNSRRAGPVGALADYLTRSNLNGDNRLRFVAADLKVIVDRLNEAADSLSIPDGVGYHLYSGMGEP